MARHELWLSNVRNTTFGGLPTVHGEHPLTFFPVWQIERHIWTENRTVDGLYDVRIGLCSMVRTNHLQGY